MPTRLIFLCLLLLPQSSWAVWTGIAAFVGEGETDWSLSGSSRSVDYRFFGFRIEEKTEVDLRIGASAGQFSVRLDDPFDVSLSEKFTGQFLSFYLRWPTAITDNLKLHTLFNYQFNLGDQSSDTAVSEIDWSEVSLRLGVSLRLDRLSIRPYLLFRSIDGDISSDSGTRSFESEDSQTGGIIFDYRVENDAYVRLATGLDNKHSLFLSFVREY